MARKPDILSDRDNWGDVLNEYLSVSLDEDGTIREEAVAGLGVETTVPDAVGEWWIHPVATYQASPYPRTVFGAIAADGAVLACEYNHGTGKTKRYAVGQAVVDDHCVPSLWVMEDRRPVIMWTNHNNDRILHVKVGAPSGDIGSLMGASEWTQDITTAPASYTQVHRIDHLSDDAQDTFWVFVRRGNYTWLLQRLTVDQATGDVSFGARTPLLDYIAGSEQIYISTADAHTPEGDNQVIRMAWGTNPTQPLHDVGYVEIDCVTGAITSPFDAAFDANLSGTNLPITRGAVTPAIADVPAGSSRRLFYVRPGPDGLGIAYADWATATPNAATYYLLEATGLDRALAPGTGNATAAYHASMDSGGFAYTVIVKTPPEEPPNHLNLGRRYQGSGVGWTFNLRDDKTLQTVFGTSVGAKGKASPEVPFAWGDTVGFRFVVNQTSGLYFTYYSLDALDESPTWTEIGGTGGTAYSGTITETAEPLIVPAPAGGALTGLALVYAAHLRDETDTTLIAGVDWRTEWDAGDTAYTDAAGRSWSLAGNAVVQGSTVTHDLGTAGPGIYAPSNYLAGLAFDNPSTDRAVIRARSDGTTDTVEKLRLADGTYEAEVLATQTSADGRLVRPIVPVGGGPFAALVTEITRYVHYTSYDGNVRGLS